MNSIKQDSSMISTWKKFPAAQQPNWGDEKTLTAYTEQLRQLPPLVFAGEIENLKNQLALAGEGKAFVVQGGDCSESFKECTAVTIRETLKVILQMSIVLSFAGKKRVVKVGRIAGQYAKPRSSDTETIDGVTLPSYRGDMVNREKFTAEDRKADPKNMLDGYFRAAVTLNLLRAFTKGGFASLKNVHIWNKEFVKTSEQGIHYEQLASQIDESISFMESIDLNPLSDPNLKEVDLFTSHEALLLDYEDAMVRKDSISGDYYDCSGHLLWIGDRTRQEDGAHVEFFSKLKNPVGIKIGLKYDLPSMIRIIRKLNPENEKGKIVLICRFGADKIAEHLPGIIQAVSKENLNVVWICDPMHGNTYTAGSYKTRDFNKIFAEIEKFFSIHGAEGTNPGGIHIELTGLDVTECVGGAQKLTESGLSRNYASNCDPRLNAQQSIELAFRLADMIRKS